MSDASMWNKPPLAIRSDPSISIFRKRLKQKRNGKNEETYFNIICLFNIIILLQFGELLSLLFKCIDTLLLLLLLVCVNVRFTWDRACVYVSVCMCVISKTTHVCVCVFS